MRQFFPGLVALFFLFQCHTSYNQTEKKDPDTTLNQVTAATHDSLEVQTNGKWKISALMLTFVDKMEEEILAHKDSQSLPVLTTNLQTLLAQMTSNQNEKGQGREPLENWMSDFKQLLERSHEFSESESIKQLKASIETFRETFY